MSIFNVVVLAIVQGLTEFLPISSSGHLVIVEKLLNMPVEENLSLEIALHFGTLLSILWMFRSKIIKLTKRSWNEITGKEKLFHSTKYIMLIFLATVPAAVVGLIFRTTINESFHNLTITAFGFIITSIVLWATRYLKKAHGKLTIHKSVLIGIVQTVAILPGISRSGTTIATGLGLNLSKKDALEFSFLLAIPAIGGASLLIILDMVKLSVPFNQHMLIGIFVSFIVGCASISALVRLIENHKFWIFAPYCLLLAGLIFLNKVVGL